MSNWNFIPNFIIFIPLFILGISSLVMQVVLARVFVVSFYGNEFFIGWILFAWLSCVGAGSMAVRCVKGQWRGLPLLISCHLLEACLFPAVILGIRAGYSSLTGVAGQIPDLMPAVIFSFFVVLPLCLVIGAHFIAAVEWGQEFYEGKDDRGFAGVAYFYEAAGFVAGGLVFTYILIGWNEFQGVSLLVFLNVMVVGILISAGKMPVKKYFLAAAGAAACLGIMCLIFSEIFNAESTALRFPGEQLVETRNSIYGNLAVTRSAGQLNFYESGLCVGSDKAGVAHEKLAHFTMLAHPDPRNVLLIGTGLGDGLPEILQHKPRKVYYAALDPAMIDVAGIYLPALRRMLEDKRVQLLEGDLRQHFMSLPFDLDVVILDLPSPSTALINRYFTDEFFREVRRHMKPGGVIGLQVTWPPNFVSGPQADCGASLYKTVSRNFSSVLVLPQDMLLVLASAGDLNRDPQASVQRLKDRAINSYFVTPAVIVDRYATDRIQKAEDLFKSNSTVKFNADLYPRGYGYNFIGWLNIFHQNLAGVVAVGARTDFLCLLVVAGAMLLLPLWIVRMDARERWLGLTAMVTGGFSLMSAEVILIYGFQVFYGDLYDNMAWVIVAFMGGAAAGTLWGHRYSSGKFIRLAGLHAWMAVYFLCGSVWMWLAAQGRWMPPPWLWISAGAGIGGLAGIEFSLVNMLKRKGCVQAGAVYTADLIGSAAGALGISMFMIPVYGIYQTLLFLTLINIILAVVLERISAAGKT